MPMRSLFLALLLLSFEAGAATGSAAVDTFYVRPASACEFNGDGMAYECAASAGASGATAAQGVSWDGVRFRQGGAIGAMACRSIRSGAGTAVLR